MNPTPTQLHNERRRLLTQGLKAGMGMERSAQCAAQYMRARHGFVPITDGEAHYLCEIGLLDVRRGQQAEQQKHPHPPVMRSR